VAAGATAAATSAGSVPAGASVARALSGLAPSLTGLPFATITAAATGARRQGRDIDRHVRIE